MIKNFVFDYGKVLIDYDFDLLIHNYFKNPKLEKPFLEIVTDESFIDRCDKGEIPFKSVLAELKTSYPEFEEALDWFGDHCNDSVMGEMEGMRDILLELKGHGYKLYGLTNWSSEVYKVISRYKIFKLLDGRIISSEEKLIKPEKAIYQRLCEKFLLRPEECLFTDDKEKNIEGAKAAGMKAVKFINAEQFKQNIKELVPEVGGII